MQNRPVLTTPPLLAQEAVREPAAPADEDARRDADADEGLDKYDVSTLACTD